MAGALITGAAGFIGSHLAARLLAEGLAVRGIDNLDPYYPAWIKERRLATLRAAPGFDWRPGDLRRADLPALLDGVTWVFHLAARPGVRASWGDGFDEYARANVLATQRLFEALRDRPVERVVFASSSSVYGENASGDAGEEAPRRPISPYGVSKLAGEGLAWAYHASYGVPVVALRYFTVYGPEQRPDMAFHRFLRALLEGREIEVYGDGRQTRDFTFVGDAVEATWRAARAGEPGAVYNIGGGSPAGLGEVIAMLETLTGREARVRLSPARPGDPRATRADTRRAREAFGYAPVTGLREGLARMAEWMPGFLAAEAALGAEHGAA
ncbi:MAG: NAD-dependent epimerase/dehydratase family protein [Candidatus Eisenbacteria bacterium]|uniref:NAD-dependent epimerase/dehydratase family protein n=1 Tax=Eiseniibacteriota bacterium TaxID=2212470 RepID=A0A937XBH8_UNCEI|nr:NAD-dependent epimerase/dehydratase family protein [Candidatus Eisenbacteria bacterium]